MKPKFKVLGTIRAAAILTGSYVPATVIENSQMYNHLDIGVFFTKGNLTSTTIKIEKSNDNVIWRQEGTYALANGQMTHSLGTHIFAASMDTEINLDIAAPYIRVSAIGDGADATGSSLKLDATLSVR